MDVLSSRFSIRLTDQLACYPREVWTLEFPEVELPAEQAESDLSEIATLSGQLPHPVSHRLRVTRVRTAWGAAGSYGDFIIEVSAGILGGAGTAGLTAGVRTVIDKIKSRALDGLNAVPLTRDQAAELVRTHIELHYSEPAATLVEAESVLAIETGGFEFSFKASTGLTYGGTVGEIAGTPSCTRVWCKDEGDRPRGRA
ncbi:hypothetical protein ACIF6L_07370 [Kitasatospora sp. NPDC086009]|uniref:hypothetical protein n=1 Tax=unclassified Kitasatospora TaxID=2633591 RepID=UPI0037C54892